MDKSAQEKVADEFNDTHSDLKFITVTAKLLTGFDASVLQRLYLDNLLKDQALLQAIYRTNRLYSQKSFGRVVDYFGVFDDATKALGIDEESVNQVITNVSKLRGQLPEAMRETLAHFACVDRSLEGYEVLEAAQNAFALDFKYLAKLWESL